LFNLLSSTTTEPFDTDKMALEFVNQFPQQAFTVGQELVFSFMEKKVLSVIIRELEGMHSGLHISSSSHCNVYPQYVPKAPSILNAHYRCGSAICFPL